MSKLGPHVLSVTDAGSRWAASAPIVKQAFGFNLLRTAPGKKICRPIWRLNKDGAVAAQQIIAFYGGFRPDYTELWNEYDEWGRHELYERIRQTRIATDILHQAGLKVAGFSFSTGTPEEAEWVMVQAAGYAGVDAIALHEYWGSQGLSTWNALRYRRAHDLLGNHPAFIITECGRDEVEGGGRGWKASGISAEQYKGELDSYDSELGRDSYVIGATVFTTGGGAGWGNFDVDELIAGSGRGSSPSPTPVTEAIARASSALAWVQANPIQAFVFAALIAYMVGQE